MCRKDNNMNENITSWFETKATFEGKVNQTGRIKRVTEVYLINAETFTDAEIKLAEIMAGKGVYIADVVRKVKFVDTFLDHKSERYYKCKVGFIVLDEKLGAVKRRYGNILVQADDIELALQALHSGMKGTLGDYEVTAIAETPYMDVLEK